MSRNVCEIPKQDSDTVAAYTIKGMDALSLSQFLPFSSVFTTFDPCSQSKTIIMSCHRVGISRARERQARVGR